MKEDTTKRAPEENPSWIWIKLPISVGWELIKAGYGFREK
jgi:hypothetical protein